MVRRRFVAVVGVAACVAGLTVVSAAPASATVRPKASLSAVHSRITSGHTPQFKYAVSGVPRGSKLYLQRQYGTGHVWKSVRTLTKHTGTVTAPAVSMGRWLYRVNVVRNHKAVVHSATRPVFAYGNLTFSQFCNRTQDTEFDGYCDSGTDQVGSRVFAYQGYGYTGDNSGPDGDAIIFAQHSSCRSATFEYEISNENLSEYDQIATFGMAMTQTNADQQTSTSVPDTIQTVTFTISSPAWDVEIWTDNGEGAPISWAGTLSCWSSTGDA